MVRALDHLAEASELADVPKAVVDRAERTAVEEIGGMHGVTRASQLLCKCMEPGGLPLSVVE